MSDLYLGKLIDLEGNLGDRYLHRITDLVTHTFICGAAGSGKTVMGKAIIEEAALKGVPAVVIDLKGDLSSLALAFSEISAQTLAPWIQVEDPSMLGRSALAEANTFRNHLWKWGFTEDDVRHFAGSVVVEIFTPRSDSARRVAIPLIPTPPPDAAGLFKMELDTALTMVSSLSEALVRRVIPSGQRDRETEYITALIEYAWRNSIDLTGEVGLHRLISLILEPPFETIGALPVADQMPDGRRQKLAQAVNGQLVGADSSWLRGEELSIDKLVGANRNDARTQISVINLAGINDFEDQSFVVSQVGFAINAWMRQQGSAPGGNRPRLLFFIDEIGGGGGKTAFYPTFPHTSTSKPALNLLVKQGRAFGVACVLATQNPGDIDYKGLANCSTWIVGKLQTKRDRDKVREGLTDAEFSPRDLAKRLARPQTGEFMIMAKDGDVKFLRERWLLTYHCTMSPGQLLRLKKQGLAPYSGNLETEIAIHDHLPSAEDVASEVEYMWQDVRESLGATCRKLELILRKVPDNSDAQAWLSVLKDPSDAAQRLKHGMSRTGDQVAVGDTKSAPQKRTSDVLELLSRAARSRSYPSPAAPVESTPSPSVLPPTDSETVDDEGCVVYKGHAYPLYRRYAGKRVSVIEENGVLHFSVDGRVLSKTHRIKS